MRRFEVVDAGSFQEAAKRAAAKDTDVMAGGTDILNVYKQEILDEHPAYVVDLKRIPDSSGIEEMEGKITVKAFRSMLVLPLSQ